MDTDLFNEISYYINNFSDLCNLLDLKLSQSNKRNLQSTKAIKALLQYKRKNALPKSIQYHSASAQLIEGLMFRAIQHWCCVSFKIVPIELGVLKSNTPNTILYCVAAISMITINVNQQVENNTNNKYKKKQLSQVAMDGFRKDIGFYFYQRACNYLKEVIFLDDDEQEFITAIQCYFCLSYTSNLLQLFSEQRTWHYLACDILKNKINYIHVSPALRQCWYRWYYIDAWISIALNEECLLPDVLPFKPLKEKKEIEEQQQQQPQHRTCCLMSNDTLYDFVFLTNFLRQFNQAMRLGKLVSVYDDLTYQAESWWYSVEKPHIHLRICYFSMRLVVLFSLLQQDYKVDGDLLVDGLNVTLEILKGVQDLKLMNCDQSTYHHMFFAIHQTLKMLLCHIKSQKHLYGRLEPFARQQFEMNLCVLEGTDAFKNDIYQMRRIGSNIEADLEDLGYLQDEESSKRSVHVFRAKYLTFSVKKQKKSKIQV